MLTRMNRKRAVCKMPLAVIERALALEPNQTLTSITNSYDNLRAGEVELIIEGDGLDEYFRTGGPAKPGDPMFYDKPHGVELWIVPPGKDDDPPSKPEPKRKPQKKATKRPGKTRTKRKKPKVS